MNKLKRPDVRIVIESRKGVRMLMYTDKKTRRPIIIRIDDSQDLPVIF